VLHHDGAAAGLRRGPHPSRRLRLLLLLLALMLVLVPAVHLAAGRRNPSPDPESSALLASRRLGAPHQHHTGAPRRGAQFTCARFAAVGRDPKTDLEIE